MQAMPDLHCQAKVSRPCRCAPAAHQQAQHPGQPAVHTHLPSRALAQRFSSLDHAADCSQCKAPPPYADTASHSSAPPHHVRVCSDVTGSSSSAPGVPGRAAGFQPPGGAAFSSMLDSALPPDVMQRFLNAAHDPQEFQSFVGRLPVSACRVIRKHAVQGSGAL